MTAEYPVSVVIVTYESSGTIGSCLDALRSASDRGIARVVVVDNASSDRTADHVAQRYPWVTLVRSDVNLGFGRGCNLGFARTESPYVLFLNPDAVISAEAIGELAGFLDRTPAAGIVAPAIIEGTDTLQAAGMMTTPTTVLRELIGWLPYSNKRRIVPGEAPFETDWVCGAALMIRSALFRQLGGFDPRFFLYFEETDLCRRAREGGAAVWALGSAVAHHQGGASAGASGAPLRSGCIAEHFYESRFYYLAKHFGLPSAMTVSLVVACVELARSIWNRVMGCDVRPRQRPLFRFPRRQHSV